MEPNQAPVAPVMFPSLPKASALISQAVALFKKKWSAAFPILAILFLSGVINAASSFLKGEAGAITSSIIMLVFLLISYLSSIALILAFSDEETKPITAYYQRALDTIISYSWIAVAMILAVIGSGIFLIIPGIIVAFYLSYSIYAFLLEDKRGLSALTASYGYIRGFEWPILWRMVVFGFLMFLVQIFVSIITGAITVMTVGLEPVIDTLKTGDTSAFFLGQIINQASSSFLFAPLAVAFGYLLYKAVRTAKQQSGIVYDTKNAEFWFKTFIYIGAGILILGFTLSMMYISTHMEDVIRMQGAFNQLK